MGLPRPTIGGSGRHNDRSKVLGQQPGVGDTRNPQRPPEGATPLRQREAGRIGMQMSSPARLSTAWIGLTPEVVPGSGRDEPQQ